MITTMKISLLLLLVLILTMSSSSCVSFFVRGEDDSADVLAVLAEESVPSGEQQEQEAMPAEVEAGANQQEVPAEKQDKEEEPLQTGPLVDLLGPKLYSLQMVNEQQAQINEHLTTDALRKKDVIGLYFSADWWCVLVVVVHRIISPAHRTGTPCVLDLEDVNLPSSNRSTHMYASEHIPPGPHIY
jgi:hypothetical protein